MQTAVIFAIGVLVGCLVSAIIRRVKSVGMLRVDRTDPDGPFIFLELNKEDLRPLMKKKYVLMRVYLRDYISQN